MPKVLNCSCWNCSTLGVFFAEQYIDQMIHAEFLATAITTAQGFLCDCCAVEGFHRIQAGIAITAGGMFAFTKVGQ